MSIIQHHSLKDELMFNSTKCLVEDTQDCCDNFCWITPVIFVICGYVSTIPSEIVTRVIYFVFMLWRWAYTNKWRTKCIIMSMYFIMCDKELHSVWSYLQSATFEAKNSTKLSKNRATAHQVTFLKLHVMRMFLTDKEGTASEIAVLYLKPHSPQTCPVLMDIVIVCVNCISDSYMY